MKIGIIGGGISGLAAAWLLEHDAHITLFEQKNYLGGHAQTTYVNINDEQIPIESGFEFFNETMFPHFFRLMDILEVPTRSFQFTYSFFSDDRKNVTVLPPIQGSSIFWRTLSPAHLANLIQLKMVINNSWDIVRTKNTSITLGAFLDKLWLTKKFKKDFFLPLFASGWGVDGRECAEFAAYDMLSWIVCNKPMGLSGCYWNEVIDGVTSYVDKLCSQMTRAVLKTCASIVHITYDEKQYTIRTSDGASVNVDHLIVATNALQARELLSGIPHALQLCEVLKGIEYIHAKIAVHGDVSCMPLCPANWSVANVLYNGSDSMLTIYKKWKSNIPLFRSWVVPGFPMPKKIYSLEEYYHAKPNVSYFNTQRIIAQLQGKNNLWIAGIYTRDFDSHESALVSGIEIAKKLAPKSERLKKLCAI